MINKLVVIINSLKVPKMKNILLCEMKFLVPNYSCLQNPWLGGYYRPQIPVLSALCPQLNLLNPPPRTKFLGTLLPYIEGKCGYYDPDRWPMIQSAWTGQTNTFGNKLKYLSTFYSCHPRRLMPRGVRTLTSFSQYGCVCLPFLPSNPPPRPFLRKLFKGNLHSDREGTVACTGNPCIFFPPSEQL